MLYAKTDEYALFRGKMQDELAELADNSVDSIVTDPPYEINFMSKGWDNSGVAFQKDTWERCLRVLKPGGYLLAFGGSRTFHRIACAIEDAGFEIRDTIMWLYGSGFPKSMNIGLAIDKKNGIDNRTGNTVKGVGSNNTNSMKNGLGKSQEFASEYEERIAQNEWQGWGTTLKPSYEPVIVARKPCDGTLTDNVLKWGVGGLNIDECRIPLEENYVYKETNRHPRECNVFTSENCGYKSEDNHTASASMLGRYPANTIFTYDDSDFDEVCGGLPSGGQSGSITKRYDMNNQVYGDYGKCNTWQAYNDSGSAARYFYSAKATTRDREEGLETFRKKRLTSKVNKSNGKGERFDGAKTPIRANIHTTVKPTALMQYLIRLVTPRGGYDTRSFYGERFNRQGGYV